MYLNTFRVSRTVSINFFPHERTVENTEKNSSKNVIKKKKTCQYKC